MVGRRLGAELKRSVRGGPNALALAGAASREARRHSVAQYLGMPVTTCITNLVHSNQYEVRCRPAKTWRDGSAITSRRPVIVPGRPDQHAGHVHACPKVLHVSAEWAKVRSNLYSWPGRTGGSCATWVAVVDSARTTSRWVESLNGRPRHVVGVRKMQLAAGRAAAEFLELSDHEDRPYT